MLDPRHRKFLEESAKSVIWTKPTQNALKLLPAQKEFVLDTHTRYLAYIGGYGAGKTYALVSKAIYMARLVAHPMDWTAVGALYEPTHDMVIDLLMPEIEKMLDELGIKYEARRSPPVHYKLIFPHGSCIILLKSFENWKRIVGNNLCWAGVDEIDTVDKKIAQIAWKKLMGRVRIGKYPQIFVTTTPEGFNFAYEWFVKHKKFDRRIIRSSTLDNPYIGTDFIKSLYENYPPQLIQAYIHGHFVNLHSGTVYYCFNREKNSTHLTLANVTRTERLHIGVDFNVGKMAAVVHIIRDNKAYAIMEHLDLFDTPALIKLLKNLYSNPITIYPDASGGNRDSTNATVTDLSLLKAAGFSVVVNPSNPRILDRVLLFNNALCNSQGERRYFVNIHTCPTLTEKLEQQGYKNGLPEKDGTEHCLDAAGYFVSHFFPIHRKTAMDYFPKAV